MTVSLTLNIFTRNNGLLRSPILLQNAVITFISDCTFTENFSNELSAVLENSLNNNQVRIINSTFSRNYGYLSGSISAISSGQMQISNCTFEENFGLYAGVFNIQDGF